MLEHDQTPAANRSAEPANDPAGPAGAAGGLHQALAKCAGDPTKLAAILRSAPPARRNAMIAEAQRMFGNGFVQQALSGSREQPPANSAGKSLAMTVDREPAHEEHAEGADRAAEHGPAATAAGLNLEHGAPPKWSPPSSGIVQSWLAHWVTLWTDIAGQAFGSFAGAVESDSNKSSNVGALISLVGDAVWVIGGLAGNPPAKILGAGLSGIGAFVQGGGGSNDRQIIGQIQQGLDGFSSNLNDNVDIRSNWEWVLKDSAFKTAGSDQQAHVVLRHLLHTPDTDNQGQLRHNIEFSLINKYLHAKKAYIQHETAYTLGGAINFDTLKNVSGNVAGAFGDLGSGLNPLPLNAPNGTRTGNPYHLGVKDTSTYIT